MKCPTCNQNLPEDNECLSMIDYYVSLAVREIVARVVSDEVGIDIMEGRKILVDLLKDERDAPENIRVWFEKNI